MDLEDVLGEIETDGRNLHNGRLLSCVAINDGITGTARRRRWMTEQKLQIIEASYEPGESVSSVARRHGVAPNLLYRWRRLMAQGSAVAVGSDEPVVGNSEVRRLEERICELERLLGRKTMEGEILKEAA